MIYFTEQIAGAIYIGDFTGATKTVYWQDASSKVNTIAVTDRKVAWASRNDWSPVSNILGKVMIADAGSTATNIITVTIPNSGSPVTVTSLSADPFGEKFFITTNQGDIWSFTSDGQNLTKLFDNTTDAVVKNVVSHVFWGAWYDPYNSNFYFCAFSNSTNNTDPHIRNLMKASVSGSTMSLPVNVLDNANQPILVDDCDGAGVNPATEEIITLKSTNPYNWSRIDSAGLKTDVTNFKDSSNNTVTRSGAPSSMFISNTGSKMYFSIESALFETGFDGNGTRTLYTGTNIQNIAVYYGATVSTIDSVVQSQPAFAYPSVPTSTSPAQTLANTGMSNSLFIASGALGFSLIILGGVMVYSRRISK